MLTAFALLGIYEERAYGLHVLTAFPSAPVCVQCTACEAITLMSVDE